MRSSAEKSDPAQAKRPRAAQQRAICTRAKIIEAAIQEFGKYGYEGATTRGIAEAAGFQHTLVTYHFQRKEGLWRETISSLLANLHDAQLERLHGLRGVDDVEKLRLLQGDFIEFSAGNLNFHRLMSHIGGSRSPQLDWLVEEYLHKIFDSRAELIRSAQAKGRYIQGDPYHLEYVFIGAATRIFMQGPEVERLTGFSPFAPEFIEKHKQLCLGLFFRDPPAAH